MQDLEKLREIEALGQEDEEEAPSPEEIPSKGGFAPIFRRCCACHLAGLLCLKAMDSPFYEAFSEWYHQEASQEIQLPSWETPAPSASPAPSPSRRPAWRL